MEYKFIVFKAEDIEKYCSHTQIEELSGINKTINSGRIKDNRKIDNRYLVVNTDEPYANDVKKVIEENEGVEITF